MVQYETSLTEREVEVVRLVARGLTNQQVAVALNIACNTVKNHLYTIYEKLSFYSRYQLIIWALRNSIITLDEIELDLRKDL